MLFRFLTALLAVLLFAACDQREVEPPGDLDFGYDYFPLDIGRTWHYEVDSITLRPQVGGILFDSVHLQARETLVDTLRDASGQLWYRGERWERRADTLPWTFRQTFFLGRTQRQGLRQEENLLFLKLVFPVDAGEHWNGHLFFDENREISIGGENMAVYAGWDYRYEAAGVTEEIGGITYDSTLVVRADGDLENAVAHRAVVEKYARGVGLVYRELEVFDTQCNVCCGGFGNPEKDCTVLPWRAKAEKGFILRQWRKE